MQKIYYSTNSIVQVLIILGLIGVLNYLSSKFFFTGDLTESKEFTLSKATKNTLKDLDDIITIEVYFSKNIPHHLIDIKTSVNDLLKTYQVHAKGNLKIDYLDPAADKEIEAKARRIGIPQVQANIIEKDQRQTVNIYLGMGIFFEDRKEVIPVIQNLGTLEYDLTSAIKKVATKEVKKIGFLTGHGEHNIYEEYQQVRQALEKQYEIRTVQTRNGEAVPEEITTLVSAGSDSLTERDLYEIDQFIMRGGKAIFLVDEVDPGNNLMGTKKFSNLNPILEKYGAKVNQDFVLDVVNELAGFSSGFFTFTLPYPFWPKLIAKNLAQNNHITAKLESVTLPWCSSIRSTLSTQDTIVKMQVLAKTTEQSWTMSEPYNLNPQQQFRPTGQQSWPVAVLLEGAFSSYFLGKPIPQAVSKDTLKKAAVNNATKEKSPRTSLIIIGDSDFLTDQNLSRFGENLLLFLNAADYLTLDESLISIRSRGKTDRPLKQVSEGTKNFIKFINMFGVCILIVGFGLVRFYIRHRDKKIFEASLS